MFYWIFKSFICAVLKLNLLTFSSHLLEDSDVDRVRVDFNGYTGDFRQGFRFPCNKVFYLSFPYRNICKPNYVHRERCWFIVWCKYMYLPFTHPFSSFGFVILVFAVLSAALFVSSLVNRLRVYYIWVLSYEVGINGTFLRMP